MTKDDIKNEYFEWIYDLICGQRYQYAVSFRKLLIYLHDTEFTYLIPRDENRAKDGINLRYRFCLACGYDDSYGIIMNILKGPCSVLEMMVALSIRCEEEIMDDPDLGDRTSQWFWRMIVSLGLGSMVDERFDISMVHDVVERFLNREYEPNGKGGLFTIRHCEYDLRDVEIWYQLCWYLDSIT